MKTKTATLVTTLLLFVMPASNVFASGGYSGGGSYNNYQPRPVDHTYETGKAIFFGRQSGVEKLEYCIKVDDELEPVKRKSIKTFKNTTYDKLSQSLVNCDQPETKIASQLSRDNFLYVTYYLNKRYKLRLRNY